MKDTVDDIEELIGIPDGKACAVNQVLYHLGERAVEWRVAALCRQYQIAIIAYSPLGQGDLLRSRSDSRKPRLPAPSSRLRS